MRGLIVTLAACSGLTLAQNDTVQFFWPHAALYQDPVVTVQSVNASATIFNVACPMPTSSASSNTTHCNWGQGLDYTIFNGSTYEATMTSGDDYTVTRTCEDKGQGGVNCYAEGYDGSISSVFLINEHWEAESQSTITATIISGAEKLSAAHVASTSTALSPGQSLTTGSVATSGLTVGVPQATGAADRYSMDTSAWLVLVGMGVAIMQ